jgi:hypothetical protein
MPAPIPTQDYAALRSLKTTFCAGCYVQHDSVRLREFGRDRNAESFGSGAVRVAYFNHLTSMPMHAHFVSCPVFHNGPACVYSKCDEHGMMGGT